VTLLLPQSDEITSFHDESKDRSLQINIAFHSCDILTWFAPQNLRRLKPFPVGHVGRRPDEYLDLTRRPDPRISERATVPFE
jgi:hypothetical protein